MKEIAVYHDQGSGEFSRACLISALARAHAGKLSVRRIRAAEICASDAWHANTALFAFPGGADAPYAALLDGPGNASIRRYVEAGGALLGVCAGAYYACSRIEFEAGSAEAIAAPRELALFAGTARGSLHDLAEPYALEHLRCADVASVFEPASKREYHALYWGGPEFVPDPGAHFEPLLHYSGGRLAALRTQVGVGRVVLSGVHAEVLGTQFAIEVSHFGDDSFAHGMRVSEVLTQLEAERSALFQRLVDALEL